jgi:outer membrane protein assembly factor BamE (lipoprotein component of BamABCDE complex)
LKHTIAFIILALITDACASLGANSQYEVFVGKTTERDLLSEFGSPNTVEKYGSDGGVKWYYVVFDSVLIGPQEKRELFLTINKNQVVTSFKYDSTMSEDVVRQFSGAVCQ